MDLSSYKICQADWALPPDITALEHQPDGSSKRCLVISTTRDDLSVHEIVAAANRHDKVCPALRARRP